MRYPCSVVACTFYKHFFGSAFSIGRQTVCFRLTVNEVLCNNICTECSCILLKQEIGCIPCPSCKHITQAVARNINLLDSVRDKKSACELLLTKIEKRFGKESRRTFWRPREWKALYSSFVAWQPPDCVIGTSSPVLRTICDARRVDSVADSQRLSVNDIRVAIRGNGHSANVLMGNVQHWGEIQNGL